jgi:predicted TPR repeat methyltransferase
MTGPNGEKVYGNMADRYDEAANTVEWKGPSLVFGLMADRIWPGLTVLDIGIGTGLGSEPFFRAGLRVFGMDINSSMLEVCKKKEIATLLLRHELAQFPYPFSDRMVDHVIRSASFISPPTLTVSFKRLAGSLRKEADLALRSVTAGRKNQPRSFPARKTPERAWLSRCTAICRGRAPPG